MAACQLPCAIARGGGTVSDASEAKHNALLELTTGLGRSVEVAVGPLDQGGTWVSAVCAAREHVQRGERAIGGHLEDRAAVQSASRAPAVLGRPVEVAVGSFQESGNGLDAFEIRVERMHDNLGAIGRQLEDRPASIA